MASGAHSVPLPCTSCGKGGAKCCTGCRLAFFCSRDCQRSAWATHAHQCNSKNIGQNSPAPRAELVDQGVQGAGMRATAAIGAGEEILTELPLIVVAAEGAAGVRQRLGDTLSNTKSRSAEAYVLHILGGVHALYDAPEHVRRAIMTELCQPVRDLAARVAMASTAVETPDPEPEQQDVVAATLRHAAGWRDAAWLSWAGNPAPNAPTALPPWLTHAEFTRFLLVFQSNAWSQCMTRHP